MTASLCSIVHVDILPMMHTFLCPNALLLAFNEVNLNFICRYIKNLMEQAGLSVREDAVGNIFGRW